MASLKATVENSYDRLVSIAPDFFVAVVFLIVGVLVAYVTKKLAHFGIKRLQSGRFSVGTAWINAKRFNWLTTILAKLTFWLTILIFVALTAKIVGVSLFDELVGSLSKFVPNILAGVLILVAGVVLSGSFKDFLERTLTAAGLGSAKNIAVAVYVVSIVIVLLISVNQIGINLAFLTSILLVIVSSFLLCGAISFGFGSAPIVTNIIATYYLRKDLKIGQSIEGEGFGGRVVEINATSIHIQVGEGLEVIPSSRLNQSGYRIKNVSH